MRYLLATLALATLAHARPDSGYHAPAPEPSYAAPAEGYGAPQEGYASPPSYGAAAPPSLDLTTLLIPILALVGLFLLFPTYVTLTSVRRKRDVGEADLASEVIDRIQDMYNVS